MLDQIRFLYEAGETRRFHTHPILREQTVAAHSWHVAMLVHVLYGQDNPGIRPVLLMAALCHDMAECKMGDLPSPGKRAMGEHFEDFRAKWGEAEEALLNHFCFDWEALLTDDEKHQLKFCDNLEGAFHCVNERAMGNKLIIPVYKNFRSYLRDEFSNASTQEIGVLGYLDTLWEKANVG